MTQFTTGTRELRTMNVNRTKSLGMNVALVIIAMVTIMACVVSASATDDVEATIAQWRAQWQSKASIDATMLDADDEQVVIARLAAMAQSGLAGRTHRVEAAFALYALHELLGDEALDDALLTILQSSPQPAVRLDAATALAIVWERQRVVCTPAQPTPSHCSGIGVYYMEDGIGTFLAESQQALQREFGWSLLVNLRVMRSIAAVVNGMGHDAETVASSLMLHLFQEPDPSVQQALASSLHAYVRHPNANGTTVLTDVLGDVMEQPPPDLDERLVTAMAPVGTDDAVPAVAWIKAFDALGIQEALPALGVLVGHPTFTVSWQAAAAANWLAGDAAVVAVWINLMTSDRPIVQKAGATALGAVARGLPEAVAMQIGNMDPYVDEATTHLLALLNEGDADTKRAALHALAPLVDSGLVYPVAPFVQLANDDGIAEDVRADAARIVARIAPEALNDIWQGERLINLHHMKPIYRSGTEGYHTFRIPAVIVTPDDTVLAFAEGRRWDPNDSGDIDLVLKRSTDGGLTWGPLQVVWDSGPHTSGNPVPVVDETTGRIWLFMTHNLGHDTEAEIHAGTSEGIRTVWVTYSDDDGVTWAPPENLFHAVQSPDTRGDGTGPGIGIQLRHGPNRGRLVIPAQGRIIYSDDNGATWQQGSRLDHTNESQVVELSDGRLLRNDRPATWAPGNAVPSRRALSISEDQGVTWGPIFYPLELVTPYVQGSTIRYAPADADDKAQVLLFANPADETQRVNMTVWASVDDGATWPASRPIYAGPSAYSSLTVLPNGTIGLLFEGGSGRPYENLYWMTFSLDWLLAGM